MPRARLRVEAAGPLTTIQDAGRFGYMRFGVTESGPVDRFAATAAVTAAGVAGPLVEMASGGLTLVCLDGEVGFAVAGGTFAATLNGRALGAWTGGSMRAGDRLVIRDGTEGNWGYLGLSGEIVARPWLGSVSTHAAAGLGGGRLSAGDIVEVEGAFPEPGRRLVRPEADDGQPIRIVLGPQQRFFSADTLDLLLSAEFETTTRFDRMGMALSGPQLVPTALDMLSEPVLRGSVQVNGKGIATVLLADHQTTGGYPKIATVISADLDRFAQMRCKSFRFRAVDATEAVAAARREAARRRSYVASLRAAGPIADALAGANLIGGVVSATDADGPD
jgi:allophanate hydrolase